MLHLKLLSFQVLSLLGHSSHLCLQSSTTCWKLASKTSLSLQQLLNRLNIKKLKIYIAEMSVINGYLGKIGRLNINLLITSSYTLSFNHSTLTGVRPLQYVYIIDQASSVKMAGYWPSSLFAFLWTKTKSRSIKTVKRERGQYPAIFTELAWSIKDLLWHKEHWKKKWSSYLFIFEHWKGTQLNAKVIARAPISWLDKCRKYNHLIGYISNSNFQIQNKLLC